MTNNALNELVRDKGRGNRKADNLLLLRTKLSMEVKSENVLYVYLCRLFGPIPPSDPYSETRPLITH